MQQIQEIQKMQSKQQMQKMIKNNIKKQNTRTKNNLKSNKSI